MKNIFINLFTRVLRHDLITGSFYIFVGGMVANVFSFLFNLFLTHKLSYANYGVYSAVLSIIVLLSIPTQAISPIVIRFATEYISKNQMGKAKRFYRKTSVALLIFGTCITIFLLFLSQTLNRFFQLNSPIYFLFAGVILTIGYLTAVSNAYLQSFLRFKYISLMSFVTNFSKFCFGLGFVLLGFGVFGALGGILLSSLLPLILVTFSLFKEFFHVKETSVSPQIGEMKSYSILAVISSLSMASFISSDILLVKHFFDPTTAGLYAGLSLIGKIIFYFSSPILTVMFPLLMNKFHKGQNMRGTLYLSILLIFFPSLLISIFYFLFPAFFINFFLGGKGFLQMKNYIGFYGLYIALFSICNILITYFLTIQYAVASYFVGLAAVTEIFGIVFYHKSLTNVISVLVSDLAILAFVLTVMLFKQLRKT